LRGSNKKQEIRKTRSATKSGEDSKERKRFLLVGKTNQTGKMVKVNGGEETKDGIQRLPK